MDARAKAVREILHSADQYLVPFFQRHYAWDLTHWRRLKGDIWALLEDGSSRQHFLGPLVCTPARAFPGEVPAYQLIDGQQRLTTLSLLLAALRDVAKRHGNNELAEEVAENYLIHKRKKDLQRYKVVPRPEDRAAFAAIIDEKPEARQNDSGIVNAWKYFDGHIADYATAHPNDGLEKLFQAVTDRLSLVMITIDGENPYEIFESLNSTGLPLAESDLIRNYLFMQVKLEEQERFHQEHWRAFESMFDAAEGLPAIDQTTFYRNYLMRNGQYSRRKTTYVDFKEQNKAQRLAPVDQVAELKHFAKHELWFRRPKTCDNPRLRETLGIIDLLDITTAYPLMMCLMDRYEGGKITEETLLSCLHDLVSFVLRRSICGESTRSYGQWFVEAIESIGNDPRVDLQKYWLKRRWPDDAVCGQKFVEFPLYRREPRKCFLILEALERSYQHKEKVALEPLSIEHIMPQTIDGDDGSSKTWRATLGEKWQETHQRLLHTLGNLTLSGYNADMGNRPYADKLQAYRNSNLVLNRRLAATYVVWNAETIVQRSKTLAGEALNLWSRPAGVVYTTEGDGRKSSDGLNRRQRRRLSYWTRLQDTIVIQGKCPKPTSLVSRTSIGFESGFDDIDLWAWLVNKPRELAVGMTFRRTRGKAIMEALREEQEEIEAQLGALTWQIGKNGYLYLSRPRPLLNEDHAWPEQHEWIGQKLTAMKNALSPRIDKLIVQGVGSKELSENRQLQLEYWTAFREFILQHSTSLKPRKPFPQHWTTFRFGTSYCDLNALVNLMKGNIGCELYLGGPKCRARYDELLKERKAIEDEIGATLEWYDVPNVKGKCIRLRREGENPADRIRWPQQHHWLCETLETFRRVFAPRIVAIEETDSPAAQ